MKITLLIVTVLLLDYLSKYYIIKNMFEGQSIPVVKTIFHITYILNSGAAFGMLENQRFIFIGVAAFLLIAFIYYFKYIKRQPLLFQLGSSLLVGGTLGNLVDRIKTGKVIDFLDFRIWPVFNFADIAICIGAGCILWVIATKQDIA